MMQGMIRRLLVFIALSMAAVSPALAGVTVTFYSHELGNSFPHAFFRVTGTLDAGGPPVDQNYGFTARRVTPAILFGPVEGEIEHAKPGYVESSDAQFTLAISDAEYHRLMAVVEKWRSRPGRSYDLNKANCVHFIGEAAAAVGLVVDVPARLMKKPRSYLQDVQRRNSGLLAARP